MCATGPGGSEDPAIAEQRTAFRSFPIRISAKFMENDLGPGISELSRRRQFKKNAVAAAYSADGSIPVQISCFVEYDAWLGKSSITWTSAKVVYSRKCLSQ